MFVIHECLTEARCDYSGKTGQAVVMSASDGSIDHAVISLAELTRLLRFKARQASKNGPPNRSGAGTESHREEAP